MELGSQFRQYSAAEVDQMTDEQALSVRRAAGGYQRGAPEAAMNDYQHTMGGGVYGHVLEHTGDLTHRMNKNDMSKFSGVEVAVDDTMPKVDRVIRQLDHPYGFEKEMGENLRSNAAYHGEDLGTHTANHEALGKKYADEHRKVPVYNYPSEVARDAAVALGEQRFDTTRHKMRELKAMQDGGRVGSVEYAPGDMRALLEHDKQGMVDYLRDKESRTPEITEAARTMLGGPK